MDKTISVPAVEFVDVLNHLDLLDADIDVEKKTVKDMYALAYDIEDDTERRYYRRTIRKWLLQFETNGQDTQE